MQVQKQSGARLSSRWPVALLLAAGVIASIVSYATDMIAASITPGYNFATQSTSVFAAPGAATRPLVLTLDVLADLLVVAFALGLWMSAGHARGLRVIAVLLSGCAVLQLVAIAFFPFDPGEPTSTVGNRVNVALMAPSIVGWFLAIAVGVVAFRNWLRYFSIALILAFVVGDVLATAGASLFVAGGEAGSLVGLQERAMGYGFWTWLALVALVQWRVWLRAEPEPDRRWENRRA